MSRKIPPAVVRWAMSWCVLLLGSGVAWAGGGQYSYLNFVISEETTVYVRIGDGKLRAATSIEGLKRAKSVRPSRSSSRRVEFKNVRFPLSSKALPTGYGNIKADLRVYESRSDSGRVYGSVSITLRDKRRRSWTYVADLTSSLGAEAESAPSVDLSRLGKLSVSFGTKKIRALQMGIGIRLRAGGLSLLGIEKSGKPVMAQMKVVDRRGKTVATKQGKISDFGFG